MCPEHTLGGIFHNVAAVSLQRWSEDIEEEMSLPSHTPGFSSSLQRLTGLAARRQLAWLPFPRVFFGPTLGILTRFPAIVIQKVANWGTQLCWIEWWRSSACVHLLMSTLKRLWYPYFLPKHERSLEANGWLWKKTRDSVGGKKGLEIILHSYSNNNKSPHLSFMTLQ